jgi:hypothetical protein
MSNHGLFVGVSALALALAAKIKDGPAPFDLGSAACHNQTMAFWCGSSAAPGAAAGKIF